jgi:hypothetical protein
MNDDDDEMEGFVLRERRCLDGYWNGKVWRVAQWQRARGEEDITDGPRGPSVEEAWVSHLLPLSSEGQDGKMAKVVRIDIH